VGVERAVHKTVVLDVVGLTPNLIGEHTPSLARFRDKTRTATIGAVTPAVTCSAQATYFTGVDPNRHGIVANGWYFRDDCEVKFWRQSNQLVQAPKVWDMARERDRNFTCANLFGWYNMYSSVDYSVTPRPMYPADGRKLPDIYTSPAGLRDELQRDLGTFPLFDFWGPRAGIKSTEWIAESAIRVDTKYDPTLTIVYLPHLDYNLQRLGPDDPAIASDLRAIDAVCDKLLRYYEARGARIMVLSEYGITEARMPVHINRALRESGWIAIREELGLELLDAGASTAFAVADHQVAHVYVNDPAQLGRVRARIEALPGVEAVLDEDGKRRRCLDHPRSGELVAIAKPDAWFTYYHWLDDRRAPDYARTVDIHRKPGYDPVELFLDPTLRFPKLKIAGKLARKMLGFRYLMDVIPLDATLVKGTHGRPPDDPSEGPLLMSEFAGTDHLSAVDIAGVILNHLFD
jgi:predicted AlkP superfamily pyrophosphatase or phosphodiesterase